MPPGRTQTTTPFGCTLGTGDGGDVAPFGLVFTGEHGLPLDGTALTKRFQGLLKAAKLPRMLFHDHTDQNTYSHVIAELNQEAADAMDRVLGSS